MKRLQQRLNLKYAEGSVLDMSIGMDFGISGSSGLVRRCVGIRIYRFREVSIMSCGDSNSEATARADVNSLRRLPS